MPVTRFAVFALVCATALTSVSAVGAQEAGVRTAEQPHAGYREVGSARDWVAIQAPDMDGTTRICALYSRPKDTEVRLEGVASELARGELAAFVNWNDDGVEADDGEVSFLMGETVAQGGAGDHALVVDGGQRFTLVGVADRLYVKPADDDAVIAAIRRGAEMVVSGQMETGHVVRDTYSLMGVQATTALARKGCE